MGKIYNEQGNKMSVLEVMEELRSNHLGILQMYLVPNLNSDLSKSIHDSQMRLAHAILDSYHQIPSDTDDGARVRKLLDYLMNKYQKSTINLTESEQSHYHFFITDIIK